MKHKLIVLSVILITIFPFINILFAQENVRPPFELKSFSISMLDSKERTAVIEFSSNFISSGDVEVNLYLPDEFKIKRGNKKLNAKKMNTGETINQEWTVQIPKDGYFLIEVNVDIYNQELLSEERKFTNYHSFPMYVEIAKGNIEKYDYKQDPKFTAPTIEDEKETNDKKPSATPVPFDTSAFGVTQQTIIQKTLGITSYVITVSISGQINYNAAYGKVKGVPNVGVYLDWDYDNNVNTGYTPYYGGNTLHVDYDITNDNGYYYFSFSFQSEYPANYYSPKIRVYANNANSAAFDGDLGNGAKFGVYYYLDISGLSTYVYSNTASITVDQFQGGALRHLYRARLFSTNNLSFTPNTIRYYIRTGNNNSFFCQPGNCGGMNIDAPRIVFNRVPDAGVSYHEYGHFVEYNKVGFIITDSYSEPHWFRKQTTNVVAWAEGWAEFYGAATHMYWYNIELPSQIEYNPSDYEYPYPRVYQFLDYSQGTLFADRNNTDVEGAVACFFYSLWDEVNRRAPNYYGDNDDISYSGSFILNNLANRYNVLGQLLGSTHIESYKTALLNALDNQNDVSVNALYNSIILKNGTPKSATPTSLSVSGNNSSRNLSWNDNTCPSSVSYQEESGIYQTFNLVQNQEQGFRIYRKATTSSWDGTLNGYTLVGIVGQNTTTWSDNTSLSGGHSYVVVAYNSPGNSLPGAENSVYYQPPLSATISGPLYLNSGQSGTWTASASGGTTPYHYQWWYMHPSTTIQSFSIIKPNNIPVDTWFTLGTDSPTLSRYDSQNFNLKCVVTDATNTQVTSNIISVSVGGSLAKISGNGEEKVGDILALAEELPTEYSLGNYPNPFNPTTKISIAIPNNEYVSLKVYDVLGREVALLANRVFSSGRYEFEFNASNLPSGTYIYSLRTDSKTISKKMLLIK